MDARVLRPAATARGTLLLVPSSPHSTAPHHTRKSPMLGTESPPSLEPLPHEAWVRAAFQELHGRSLHGFTLLLTLGDLVGSARLAGMALGAGIHRVDELRHPERAAAWLRAHVVSRAERRRPASRRAPTVIEGLGVDAAVMEGLAALRVVERAALIASDIEHLDQRDVATIVRRSGSGLRHLETTARQRYLAAYLRLTPEATIGGPLTDRLQEIGRQTIG
jgi:hypothetical protein